jgi:hypothetical protein
MEALPVLVEIRRVVEYTLVRGRGELGKGDAHVTRGTACGSSSIKVFESAEICWRTQFMT